jgi:hypothetical protein
MWWSIRKKKKKKNFFYALTHAQSNNFFLPFLKLCYTFCAIFVARSFFFAVKVLLCIFTTFFSFAKKKTNKPSSQQLVSLVGVHLLDVFFLQRKLRARIFFVSTCSAAFFFWILHFNDYIPLGISDNSVKTKKKLCGVVWHFLRLQILHTFQLHIFFLSRICLRAFLFFSFFAKETKIRRSIMR